MNKPRVHSWQLRIWHWLDAIVVVSLVTTYFLRNALVSHSRFLVTKLSEAGVAVTLDTAKPFIRELVGDLWAWHINLGYALAALLLLRIVIVFTDQRNPFVDCWQEVCRLRRPFDFRDVQSTLVKTLYLAFYLLQLFMVFSGLSMVFGKSLGFSKDFTHFLGDIHATVMWFFFAFAILHIVGVFIAENTGDAGIVSAMINGGKRQLSQYDN